MTQNIDETLKERGTRYGEFPEHADITQGIKAAMGNSRNWYDLDNDMKECLEMVAHKVGRILNGDPNYIDSWTDIIGYTRLVEKRLIDEQETVKAFAFPGMASAFAANETARQSLKKDVEPAQPEQCNCALCQEVRKFNQRT